MTKDRIDNYKLWQKYKEKNDDQAREELILEYLSLVKYQAGRVNMLVPDFIEIEDLESFGIIGLMDAIEKFDYRRGIKFTTYASRRIRGEIIDHLRKLDWLPHSLRRNGKKIKKAAERLKKEMGRKPTREELKEELSLPEKKFSKIYRKIYSANWVSLYDQVQDKRIIDYLEEDGNNKPEKIVDKKEYTEILTTAIERLKEKEKLVIALYYYEDLTQKEIAEVLGLSPARISQLHKKAVYRLRGFLSNKKELFK